MILEAKHFINGVEIVPQNFDEIGFKIDYSQDYNLPELNTDSVILVTKARQLVLDHIDTLDDESFSELQDAMKELLDDCSKSNFKKVGKFLIKLMRKETE